MTIKVFFSLLKQKLLGKQECFPKGTEDPVSKQRTRNCFQLQTFVQSQFMRFKILANKIPKLRKNIDMALKSVNVLK